MFSIMSTNIAKGANWTAITILNNFKWGFPIQRTWFRFLSPYSSHNRSERSFVLWWLHLLFHWFSNHYAFLSKNLIPSRPSFSNLKSSARNFRNFRHTRGTYTRGICCIFYPRRCREAFNLWSHHEHNYAWMEILRSSGSVLVKIRVTWGYDYIFQAFFRGGFVSQKLCKQASTVSKWHLVQYWFCIHGGMFTIGECLFLDHISFTSEVAEEPLSRLVSLFSSPLWMEILACGWRTEVKVWLYRSHCCV